MEPTDQTGEDRERPSQHLELFSDIRARPPEEMDIEIGGVIELKPWELIPYADTDKLEESIVECEANIERFKQGIAEQEEQIEFLQHLINAQKERARLIREEQERADGV